VAEARAAGLLVIGDVKRGDIQSSARAYSQAFLGGAGLADARFACDAITINPLLGADSIEPFLAHCRESGCGLFVLVRTSNPSSADFQRHGEPELSHAIAAAVDRWGEELLGSCGLSSVGAVVGATHSRELRDFRARLPRTPILLPGYGAQGGGARDVMDAFLPGAGAGGARGALVSSSRGILYAWREPQRRGLTWQEATLAALDEMVAAVGEALEQR
jgi:orotidine-5'-phosphate decarboxylase